MTAIQKYEELGFTNDFMFSRIMQDKKICKPFLEMILGIKIDHIEYLESQKTIDLKVDAKSVRLDIFVDKCSVEIFLNEGKIAMSNLVFPTEPYNRMCFYSKGGTFKVDTFKVHRLSL